MRTFAARASILLVRQASSIFAHVNLGLGGKKGKGTELTALSPSA